MKITRSRLKEIIKEELEAGMQEGTPGDYYDRKQRKSSDLFDKVNAKREEMKGLPMGSPERRKARKQLKDLEDLLDLARHTGD
tara:strand:- start:115 stop:363 length:249 start_codon:yes stop_codon:yes gene_type:complete